MEFFYISICYSNEKKEERGIKLSDQWNLFISIA